MATLRLHVIVRRTTRVVGISVGIGATSVAAVGTYLYNTHPGFQRSAKFWSYAGPIVLHYAWAGRWAQNEDDKHKRFQILHAQYAPKARAAIEELRGMFVKVGQVLSVRPEITPEEYRNEFRKLQDHAPPAQWAPIRKTLERDLGKHVFDSLDHVEEAPLGAASIGQAHLVQWHGQHAVLKVQYPDAAMMLHADFACLETLLWLIGKLDALRIVRQLREQFEVELDYAQEARHLRALHAAISAAPEFNERIVVPAPIEELTNGSVVGMEYLPGPKLESVLRQRLEALGLDLGNRTLSDWVKERQRQNMEQLDAPSHNYDAPNRFAFILKFLTRVFGMDFLMWLVRVGSEIKIRLFKQPEAVEGLSLTELRETLHQVVSVHGFQLFFCPFFNGDPHPGNILLLSDGRIGLIDFGQCREVSFEERERLAKLFVTLSQPAGTPGLDSQIAAAFKATGVQTKNSDEQFLALIPRLMFGALTPELLDRRKLVEIFKNDKIEEMPTHMIMVYRASMLLRGLCLILQENVSVAEIWSKWALRWLQENSSNA